MTDESAGATPVEPGATPGQNDDTTAADPQPPATGDVETLKRALESERSLRRAAEKAARAKDAENEALRTSQLTEHEKAIAQARKEGSAETEKVWSERLRTSEVRRELQAAGIAGSLDLASRAPEFEALTIGEEGRVEGLDKAVAAFKAANPFLFAAPRPAAGNFDGGSGGSPAQTWTAEAIGAMSQAEFERNEAEIMRAMREGRIRQ